jgi:hypothetical protein
MATLPTQSFATIVSQIVAGMQGRTRVLADFAVGSVLRAFAEAYAGVALWLQGMILKVLQVTRLATSQGIDVDSWTADYMPGAPSGQILSTGQASPRLPASAATGLVTFSRITAGANAIVIPVGAQLQTSDGSQQFTVYANPKNSAYSSILNGYVLPANTNAIDVSAQANTPGSAGNVVAGFISQLQSSVPGIDTVSNSPFINGKDAETDAALKARFVQYIASLREGTEGAVTFAVSSLQQGMQIAIHEQADPNQATDYGMVTVFIDDGSGAPSGTLVTAANNAVAAVRAAGVRIGVYGASPLLANVSMTVVSQAGLSHPTVVGNVQNALGSFINGLGLEATLPITQLAAVAYGVAGVQEVQNGFTVNASTADLVPGWGQSIKAGTIAVS